MKSSHKEKNKSKDAGDYETLQAFVRVNVKVTNLDATSITNKDLLLIILQFRDKIFSSKRSTNDIDNIRMMQ